jgi:hypothetical protein
MLFLWFPARQRRLAVRRRPRRFIPRLEALEDRFVPATITWVGPNIGDWDQASNWRGGAVPGPNDDAVIASPDVTVTHLVPVHDDVHSLSSAGAVRLLDGTLSIGDGVLNDLTISGGELDVSSTLETNGQLTWSGGVLGGSGAVYTAGGLTITGPEEKRLDTVFVVNFGRGSWDGGSVRASGGAAVIGTDFVGFTAGGSGSFEPVFYNYGAFFVDASAGVVHMQALYNAGLVDLEGGGLEVGSFIQYGGVIHLSGGSLFSPNTVRLSGGSLTGPGLVGADLVNNADVQAGGLVVLGNYTQTSSGSLEVSLDGVANEQPAPLTVRAVASLAGTLNVGFPGGVVVSPGERFVVLTAATVAGQFDSVHIASPPGGATLTTKYESGAVTLVGAAASSSDSQTQSDLLEEPDDLLASLETNPGTEPLPEVLLHGDIAGAGELSSEFGATGVSGQSSLERRDATPPLGGAAEVAAAHDSASATSAMGGEEPLLVLGDGDGGFTVALEIEPNAEETTSVGDHASALLTGGHPRVAVVSQPGSPVAAVATLLADEGDDAHTATGPSTVEEGSDVNGLLVNPVAAPRRGSTPQPSAAPPASPLVIVGVSALAAANRRRRTPATRQAPSARPV